MKYKDGMITLNLLLILKKQQKLKLNKLNNKEKIQELMRNNNNKQNKNKNKNKDKQNKNKDKQNNHNIRKNKQ